MCDASTDPLPESPPSTRSVLQHVTVERDDVAVCTMFPWNVADDSVSTQWLTAGPDSFVSLEDAR